MKLSELNPDIVLASLLSGEVRVQASTSADRKVKAYAQAEQPQNITADEFILILNNGIISSKTQPIGLLSGNLALTIYSKSNSNGTAKRNRINSMIDQCVEIVDKCSAEGFFFELSPTNIITPTTVNLTNGYATTVLNVKWRNQSY